MAKKWEGAARARLQFADLVEGLTTEQLQSASWCEGWTVHTVAAHVAYLSVCSRTTLTTALLRAGGNWNRAADRLARRDSKYPIVQLIGVIRRNADRPLPVPGAPENGTIADVAIHTQDVRRPLGLDGDLGEEEIVAILQVITEERVGRVFSDPADRAGLRFVATDIDWTYGDGPTVEGPAEPLALAMAGRPTLDQLSGDGLDTFRRRLGSS